MYYLRKSWVPHTCPYCNDATKPTKPEQARIRSWSGSRMYARGWHMCCLLKELYKGMLFEAPTIYDILKTSKPDEFQGAAYYIPAPLKIR